MNLYEVRVITELVIRLRAEDEEQAKLKTAYWNLWLGGPDPKDDMKQGDPNKVFERVAWGPTEIEVGEVI